MDNLSKKIGTEDTDGFIPITERLKYDKMANELSAAQTEETFEAITPVIDRAIEDIAQEVALHVADETPPDNPIVTETPHVGVPTDLPGTPGASHRGGKPVLPRS